MLNLMPSAVYVAKALHGVGADAEWDDVSAEEQKAHMELAKVAIDAIWSWQKIHKPDGEKRYAFEAHDDGWIIFDRLVGRGTVLGVIHDPLLTQQIVDDLNRQPPKGPVYGD